MSRTGWKEAERKAATLIGGKRYPANMGGRIDCESDKCVAQVKEVGSLSLAQLTALAAEMEDLGREQGKSGLVVVKHSAGRGNPTPYLVVATENVWRALFGDAVLV
jgi:hypothetical protein